MKRRIFYILFIIALLVNKTNAQTYNAPQIYNTVSASWFYSEKWSWHNQVSYNFMYSNLKEWNEVSLSSTSLYSFHKNIEATGGVNTSWVNQNENLSSFEFRPSIGLRFFRTMHHRFSFSNFSKLELRSFFYSDSKTDLTFRFRNKTNIFLSLIKPTIDSDKNLFFFGYAEWFYNFENTTREQFFNLFKVKAGFGYRLNFPWRFTFGVVYQDTKDNTKEPSNLPANFITDYIFEWQVIYVIGKREKE